MKNNFISFFKDSDNKYVVMLHGRKSDKCLFYKETLKSNKKEVIFTKNISYAKKWKKFKDVMNFINNIKNNNLLIIRKDY